MSSPFARLMQLRAEGDAKAIAAHISMIVKDHLSLAYPVARALKTRLPYVDRVQEAALALFEAVEHYDHERGAFEPYARTVMTNAILRASRRDQAVVGVDVHVVSLDAPLLCLDDGDEVTTPLDQLVTTTPDASALLTARESQGYQRPHVRRKGET